MTVNNSKAATSRQAAALTWLGTQIHGYEKATWRWQRVMGTPVSRTSGESVSQLGIAGAKTALRRWQRLAAAARRQAQHPPHYGAFLCIHHYEGSWNDSGSPYYGGLQMNIGFQATYGGWLLRTKGTADHWTPLEQIWVAEKAVRSRGFYPWPLTARYCGLI
jgi:Transglycosylase-like domain